MNVLGWFNCLAYPSMILKTLLLLLVQQSQLRGNVLHTELTRQLLTHLTECHSVERFTKGSSQIMTTHNKIKQAGAELCQAQFKLC